MSPDASLTGKIAVSSGEAVQTITVSSAAGLKTALSGVTGDTVILLDPGDYGNLSLSGSLAGNVTIRSAEPSDAAVFHSMNLSGVDNLTFDTVKFDYVSASGAPDYTQPFTISSSSNIKIENSTFDGDNAHGLSATLDGYGTGWGLYVINSNDITLSHNEYYDWDRAALFNNVDGLVVQNNDVYDIRSDGFDFVNVDNTLIEQNYMHDFRIAPLSDDHPDMIQFWTAGTTSPSTNITISENFLNSGAGDWTQSIFMRNEAVDSQGAGYEMFYQNILIENNVIYNAHTHGITVGETDGLIIRNNTILHNADSADGGAVYIPTIHLADASLNVVVADNIAPALTFQSNANRLVENNLAVQRDNPNGANYYGDLFVNALANSAATLADLMAVPGGIIDQLNVGSSLTQPSADPANSAPTDITLSNTTIAEDSPVGAVVGALAAVDPDNGDSSTFTLINDAGGHFAVSGANLVLAKAVDYETAQSQTVTVQVTNSAGNSFEKDLTIGVTDVAPGAPTDANSGQNKVVEGAASGTEVGITALASDVNGGTVTYSLDDDAGGRFAIDPNTGVVSVADASGLDHNLAPS